MVSQVVLRAISALVDSDKNVAEKALSTRKCLQGDSQGGYVGNALKKVEDEG